MDLIGSLSSSLGVPASSAQGAVGSLLALVKQHAPADVFGAVESQAPETKQWITQAASPAATDGQAGGLLGGLLGAAGGALGGGLGAQLGASAGPLGSLISALSQHGLKAEALGTLVPMVLQYLQGRVGADLVGKLIASVPFLSHLAGGAEGKGTDVGSVLGSLGSLFK